MSVPAIIWAVNQELPAMQKIVLVMLANFHNDETGQCNPSITTLMKDCGMKKTALLSALNSLEPNYLVKIQSKKGNLNDLNQYNLKIEFSSPLNELGSPLNEPPINLALENKLIKTNSPLNELGSPLNEPNPSSLNSSPFFSLGEKEKLCWEWVISQSELCNSKGKKQDFWFKKIDNDISKFNYFYSNGKLKQQYEESEAKKTRASYSTTGTGNSFNEQNVGGHYASNSNIVQFRSKSNSIADRLAQQLAYCEWEEQQQRDSHEQQLVN